MTDVVVDPETWKVAPPGSDAALEQGCLCPVLDNSHGRGFPVNGRTEFWVSADCPMHNGVITTDYVL